MMRLMSRGFRFLLISSLAVLVLPACSKSKPVREESSSTKTVTTIVKSETSAPESQVEKTAGRLVTKESPKPDPEPDSKMAPNNLEENAEENAEENSEDDGGTTTATPSPTNPPIVPQERLQPPMAVTPPPAVPRPMRTPSGLQYVDVTVGAGPEPAVGKQVTVHYTGWLQDGSQFDSSIERGQPFTFTIGQGQVIKGWDEGVMTMKVGGKRKLIIPPELAYGPQGAGGVIPPDATLIFEVDLLAVQ
jgi:peptidylprolyl isomerase